MTTQIELEKLVVRIEALSGSDYETDLAIASLGQKLRWPGLCGYEGPINYDVGLWMQRHGANFTASLDDAMTLVPEGWGCVVRRWADGTGQGVARCYPPEGSGENTHAATPALALCAAALRARAADAPEPISPNHPKDKV